MDLGSAVILPVFVLFCRIGACLMLMPGLSSPRVPVQVRLFIALAITLGLSPLLLDGVRTAIATPSPDGLTRIIASETTIGAMIGLMGRIFFMALETLATATTMAIGLGNVFAQAIDSDATLPDLASFVSIVATTIFFVSDLPYEVFQGLALSYNALPVGAGFQPQGGLIEISNVLGRAFLLALRISNPFIIFAIVVNLAIGLLNKLTPQIPVYFIAAPFIAALGLFLLYFSGKQMLISFMQGFADWLTNG